MLVAQITRLATAEGDGNAWTKKKVGENSTFIFLHQVPGSDVVTMNISSKIISEHTPTHPMKVYFRHQEMAVKYWEALSHTWKKFQVTLKSTNDVYLWRMKLTEVGVTVIDKAQKSQSQIMVDSQSFQKSQTFMKESQQPNCIGSQRLEMLPPRQDTGTRTLKQLLELDTQELRETVLKQLNNPDLPKLVS